MLGKLHKIDLRKAWKHEAHDFTNWLAQDENLALLSDEIGIGIKLIQTEAKVGDFSVDILAEDEGTGKKIIIENQLEPTNHDHLGKIITYASGYESEIMIWLVEDIRDEHKQAINWLNDHTDKHLNFFLIRIELWQIDESPFAPKFHVVCQPNDWAKAIKESISNNEFSDTKMNQYAFWTNFKDFVKNKHSKLKLRKSYPQHWLDIGYGSSESHISLTINTQANKMGCEIYISDSKELFRKYYQHKDEIEAELGEKLEWLELPGKKASRIKLIREGDITEKEKWPEYFNWLREKAEKFNDTFGKYHRL